MEHLQGLSLDASTDWDKLDAIVLNTLEGEKSGHDYAHSIRVLKNALEIAKSYPGIDLDVLVAGCLLHDIACRHGAIKGHHIIGAQMAGPILNEVGFPNGKIKRVQEVIEDHVGNIMKGVREESDLSIESKIVRDADNVDAVGSIGLIRQIAFSTHVQKPYFKSEEDELNDSIYGGVKTIMTWVEKMHTPEAKKIANERLEIMGDFLEQLKKEME